MRKEVLEQKKLARRRKERRRRALIIVVGVIALGAMVYGILAPSLQPEIGEAAEEMSPDHVFEGEDPGPYNTDPPTSGAHYAGDLEAGFYHEVDATRVGPYPEGYLVHNLEHGYVIFWYNCKLLDDVACDELKTQIQAVMEGENYFKVIGFPRASIDVPVVMTSWGRSLSFDAFDPDLARQYVRTYRNQAPEPHAP